MHRGPNGWQILLPHQEIDILGKARETMNDDRKSAADGVRDFGVVQGTHDRAEFLLNFHARIIAGRVAVPSAKRGLLRRRASYAAGAVPGAVDGSTDGRISRAV